MANDLGLPTAPPAIIAVAKSPSRSRIVVESACSWQRGCAVAIPQARLFRPNTTFLSCRLVFAPVVACSVPVGFDSFNLCASVGMYQVDSFVHSSNVIDDVAASAGDGRCAALVLCGTLDECGGSAEDWALLAKRLPADLLLFSNTIASDFTAVAAEESGHIIQRLIGSMDVLWTDVVGLFQLFDADGDGPSQIQAEQSGGKMDGNAIVIDLLQCMVRTRLATL